MARLWHGDLGRTVARIPSSAVLGLAWRARPLTSGELAHACPQAPPNDLCSRSAALTGGRLTRGWFAVEIGEGSVFGHQSNCDHGHGEDDASGEECPADSEQSDGWADQEIHLPEPALFPDAVVVPLDVIEYGGSDFLRITPH